VQAAVTACAVKRIREHSVRVLVADDDPIVRSLIRSKISVIASEVVEAADGLEAWQLLAKDTFQLALVDLEMPNLDGFTLIQCIRSHPRTRHMPIVVVTCREDHAALREALEAGASSYMIKPLKWSMFNAHVEHLLRLSAQAEAADLALRKQQSIADARHKLFAGFGAEIASTVQTLRSTLAKSSEPKGLVAQGVTSEIERMERTVARYASALETLDGIPAAAMAATTTAA
jgi:CheY-like chemotaxis protein